MKLYENIKKYRNEKGLSQEQLAELMGYSEKSMISKIEKGQVELGIGKIMKFAEVLGVPADVLMGFDISEAYNNASPDTQKAVFFPLSSIGKFPVIRMVTGIFAIFRTFVYPS